MRIASAIGMCALSAACVTVPREGEPSVTPFDATLSGFPEDIRSIGIKPQRRLEFDTRLRKLVKAGDGSLDILALSGGGAGGSFGAGVIVGMTRAGNRPQFEVVTGVSTGALIAPFAFLGADWDDELTNAFASDEASDLLEPLGLASLFEPSVYRGTPLRELVNGYVTPELISAVAAESRKGRMLLVATTDLDVQQTVYWDMGRIAEQGGEAARELFRDVLVASASVPGVFPPVMMSVMSDGKAYSEMHVDGGTTVPLFLGPAFWTSGEDSDPIFSNANIYIIVNGQLQAPARNTPINTVQIMARSFDTMLTFSARLAIREHHATAREQDMKINVAFIPTDYLYSGPLDFKASERQTLFAYARSCASNKLIWFDRSNLPFAMQNWRVQLEDVKQGFGVPDHCPVQRVEELIAAQESGAD